MGVARLTLAIAAAATVACGAEDPPPPGGGQGGSSGGAGGAADGGTGPSSLTVHVKRAHYHYGLGSLGDAANAVVALDLPGGRVEETTDGEGIAVFQDLDWSSGSLPAVTAYLPGHRMTSYLELSPDSFEQVDDGQGGVDHRLQFVLPQLDAPADLVAIDGTLACMEDEQHWLWVSATNGGNESFSAGSAWSFDVRANESFTVLAMEIDYPSVQTASPRGAEAAVVQWVTTSHAAIDQPATIEMAAADQVAPTVVHGAFPIPDHGIGDLFDIGSGGMYLVSLDSGGRFTAGLTTWIDLSADGRSFEYDFEYVMLDGVQRPFWHWFIWDGDRFSTAAVEAYPEPGYRDVVLPEPPEIGALPAGLSGTLEWRQNAVDGADDNLDIFVEIFLPGAGTDHPVWRLLVPPGRSSVLLPELPSNVDPSLLFGPGDVDLRVSTCESDPVTSTCTRRSQTGVFSLHP